MQLNNKIVPHTFFPVCLPFHVVVFLFMKFLSAEFEGNRTNTPTRCAVFERKKGIFSLESRLDSGMDDLLSLKGSASLVAVCGCPDFSAETVHAPASLKGSSLRLFLRSKTAGNREKSTVRFGACSQPEGSGEKECQAYIMPDRVYEKESGLDTEEREAADIFTLSPLALCGITSTLYPDRLVLHAYADESKLIITISKGDEVFYARTAPAADRAMLAGELELTLTHTAKSRNLRPDLILLSGLYATDGHTSDQIRSRQAVQTVLAAPDGILAECPFDVFHKIIIPFGAVLNGKKFDFTPEKYRKKKIFSKTMFALNSALLVILVALTAVNLHFFSSYKSKTEELAKAASALRADRELTSEILSASPSSGYLLTYLNILNERDKNPVRLLADVEPLIMHIGFDRVIVSRTEPIVIAASKEFGTLNSLTEFEEEIKAEITRLESKKYTVQNDSRFGYDNLVANIKLNISRRGAAE